MKTFGSFRRRRSSESGYALMVILLMLALLVIALVAVAPRVAQQIRREREEEMIHRGNEYARAVKRYYRKFGRYPARIEELENTNNIRFLRKRYTDPMSGQEFKLLRYGQQKTQPRGLFGAAAGTTGAAGAIGGGLPGAIVGNAMSGNAMGGNAMGASNTSSSGQAPVAPGTPAASMSTALGGGQTLGGAPIIGVIGTKDQSSIKEWNGKANYKDWEFYYDPRFDTSRAQPAGAGQTGLPGTNPLNPAGTGAQPNPQPQNPQNPQPPLPR